MTGFIKSIFHCHICLPPQGFIAVCFQQQDRYRFPGTIPGLFLCFRASLILSCPLGTHTQHCWPISRGSERKFGICTRNPHCFHYFKLHPLTKFQSHISLKYIVLNQGALYFQQSFKSSYRQIIHTKLKERRFGLEEAADENSMREDIGRVIGYRKSNTKFLICYLYSCSQTAQLKNCNLRFSPIPDKTDTLTPKHSKQFCTTSPASVPLLDPPLNPQLYLSPPF